METITLPLDVVLAEHADRGLPISTDEDIRIRKMDLFGKEDDLTQEEEEILARNVKRFLGLYDLHQGNQTHTRADIQMEYFQPVFEKLAAEGIECSILFENINPTNKRALIEEAFSISRDAILIMGSDQYDKATMRLERNPSHDIDPTSIVEEPANEIAEFYADESMNPNFWEEANPLAWARDCLLLASYPDVLQTLMEYPRDFKKVPSVYRFIQELHGIDTKNQREAEVDDHRPLLLAPEQLEMLQIFSKVLEGMENNPLNRYAKMGYKALTNPSQGNSTKRAHKFLNAVMSQIPQGGDEFQYQLALCATNIAQSIRDQRKSSPSKVLDGLPNKMDICNVIEAAKRFAHLALLKNPFERESEEGKRYSLKPQPSTPDFWVFSIFRGNNLLHRRLENPTFDLNHGLTQTDREIFSELLAERKAREEEIIRTFQVQIGQTEANKESAEAVHTLYILVHFLCRIADEHRKKIVSIGSITSETSAAAKDTVEI
ncbi:MAG: hypothetical protein R3B71_03055 [Candidatus Gracilibacteria bacterium]